MVQIDEIPDVFKNLILTDSDEINQLSQSADDVISNLRQNFISATKENIIRMQQMLKDVCFDPEEQARVLPDVFFRIAHDIKGQGTTFGYPVLTDLGVDICNILRHRNSWTQDELNRLEQDVADMWVVIHLSFQTKSSILDGIKKRLKGK